jgi:hypothetical protein
MVMTTNAPGLFPEPDPVDPPAGVWATSSGGWAYGFFGEDGEYLVIVGHADQLAITEVFRSAGIDYDPPGDTGTKHTWARNLLACPEHSTKDDSCRWCVGIYAGEPWLDWATTVDGDLEAHRTDEDYFRVTVIDMEV